MKASAANLLSIIKGPRQFIIPIYQRTYSWQIPQCSKLLEDILQISNNHAVPGHFIGSVVYFQESIHTVSDVPKLLVIDGQQRLTTVSLLIQALAEFVRDNAIDLETNFTRIQNYYLLNADEEGELRYKLILTRRDKETLINVIKGIAPAKHDSQRIVENYNFFKSKINQNNAVAIYNGILRLIVVDVALERDKDNPQLIFESMNSTGLDLSQADLIRNFILMGQEHSLQTELYEKYWFPMEQRYGNEYTAYFNPFMRDYLSVKTGAIPRLDRVYEEFKKYFQNQNVNNGMTMTDVVRDIYTFSGYYVNMILHKEPDPVLLKGFRNISRIKVDVSYPFLLPVYDDYVSKIISVDEFSQIIGLVENYVFRRAICGIPTNSLNKTFVTLYSSINKSNYLESIQVAFLLLDSYKRFPSDVEFERELMIKDLYSFRNRNYLLSRLENHHRKEFVNIEDYTVEHIMPQNQNLSLEWQTMLGDHWKEVHGQYLHTLGNLTLTGYNSELSDHPFEKKKTMEGGFNDSPIRLNDFLRTTEVWNEAQIKARAKELASKAREVWAAPRLSEEVLSKYRPEEKESNQYSLSSYLALTGNMLDLFEALRKRILNIDASVREEYTKLYIAFKGSTNFVDVIPQKARLRLVLNMDYEEIIDPKGHCRDVTNIGVWGNGNVETGISDISQLDEIMDLIQQAFEVQLVNG